MPIAVIVQVTVDGRPIKAVMLHQNEVPIEARHEAIRQVLQTLITRIKAEHSPRQGFAQFYSWSATNTASNSTTNAWSDFDAGNMYYWTG